jgi:hypothetical protein
MSWRLDGAMFVMTWIERYGPSRQQQRSGFVSTVVTSMVKQTVNGEVQLDYAPAGVVWNLTYPAGKVSEWNAPIKTWSLARGQFRFCGIGRDRRCIDGQRSSRSPALPVLPPLRYSFDCVAHPTSTVRCRARPAWSAR